MICLGKLSSRFYSLKTTRSGIKLLQNQFDIGNVSPVKIVKRLFANEIRSENDINTPPNKKSLQHDKEVDKNVGGMPFEAYCDVLIIGGGAMGSSSAYWLTKKARKGLKVVVLEKDCTYATASTVLSVGGLRQQFSLPENIQMSLYGADFIRRGKTVLGDVPLNFTPNGYLTLASMEGAETLRKNSILQNELGAKNKLLTTSSLKQKFPWLQTEGIELGCIGLEKEGWFDPWAFLMGLKKKAIEYGTHFINGEAVGFEFMMQENVVVSGQKSGTYEALDRVVVQLPNGEKRSIKFAICILATGADSKKVGQLANIGLGDDVLSVPIPVEPRKRYVYVFNCQGTSSASVATPLTIDPNGTYFRRDGYSGNYLCGRSPDGLNEPPVNDLTVDDKFFETDVWPTLAKRVKDFESIKVTSSWAGFYDYNFFDQNGIVGPHPYYNNLYIATGFSGHGIQQAPAVGRAISELIIDGKFRTIDLYRLGFDRLIVNKPLFEENIV